MYLEARLIADTGGLLSHTAVVGRELTIPCVVNTKIAQKTPRDSDIIR